jgi:hypothetical protein
VPIGARLGNTYLILSSPVATLASIDTETVPYMLMNRTQTQKLLSNCVSSMSNLFPQGPPLYPSQASRFKLLIPNSYRYKRSLTTYQPS